MTAVSWFVSLWKLVPNIYRLFSEACYQRNWDKSKWQRIDLCVLFDAYLWEIDDHQSANFDMHSILLGYKCVYCTSPNKSTHVRIKILSPTVRPHLIILSWYQSLILCLFLLELCQNKVMWHFTHENKTWLISWSLEAIISYFKNLCR